MKKLMIAVSMMAALLLTSCGGRKDANGWYSDFNAAKKAAQSKNKSILLFVNSDLDVEGSENGVAAVLSKEFTSALKNDYVFVHFAFTDMQSILSNADAEISSKEQKALENRKKVMREQFKIADMYTVEVTPSVTLLTKDGYYASSLSCEYSSSSVQGYVSLVKDDSKYIDNVNEMIAKTKKGSMKDKVNAIADLHDSMNENHRLAFGDLIKKAVAMDKKNVTGRMESLIPTAASIDAYNELSAGKVLDAAKIYAKYAEDSRLDKETAQYMMYYAAQFAAKAKDVKIEIIKNYLEKAVAFDPESDAARQIGGILAQINGENAEGNGSAEETAETEPAASN